MLYFCQKSEEFQKNYIKKFTKFMEKNGYNMVEIGEMVEIIKCEKMLNIPKYEEM